MWTSEWVMVTTAVWAACERLDEWMGKQIGVWGVLLLDQTQDQVHPRMLGSIASMSNTRTFVLPSPKQPSDMLLLE